MTRADAEGLTSRILDLLQVRGVEAYFGEPVTQLEHALQGGMMDVAQLLDRR